MAKIDKVISIKVEGVRRIKELEDSLKKLRKEQRDNKKQSEGDANRYSKTAKAIKEQSTELRGLRKQMAGVNETTKKGNKLQDSMFKGVVKGAAAFSILVTAFRRVNAAITSMTTSFTEFEFTMAKVRAVSGATNDEFKELESSAAELGRTTFFTASQVAQLQLNFSKLGFTTNEILAAQEATINLSIATGSDLARAATVAGSAIRGFGLDATETTRVVDVMAVAFTSSALDIEKFQTSMTKVAPIAAAAGFSIEETTAIMSKLSDTGIEASIAGTSLRNIFLKLQDPTSKLSRRFGNTVPNLEELLKGLREMSEAGDDFQDILGLVDVRQVAAFQTMVTGAEDVAALAKELENSAGAGQNMADIVGDTTQGALFRLKSALEGLSIAIMDNFGNSLKETLIKLADFITSITKNTKLLNNIGTALKLIAKLLLAYAIRAKFARFETALLRGGFTGLWKSITRSIKGITAFKFSLKGLKAAIAGTGIGFLVILLAELAASFMFATDEAERYKSAEERVKEGMVETNTQIAKVQATLESLSRTREKMNKLADKEGKLYDDNAVNLEKYNRLKKQEKTDIETINGFMKTYNQELVDQKDNIDDIVTSTNNLITAMKDKALAQVFSNLQSQILNIKVSSDLILDTVSQFEATYDNFGKKDIGSIIEAVEEGFAEKSLGGVFETKSDRSKKERAKLLQDLLDNYGITIAQFKKAIEDGYYDNEISSIQKSVENMAGGKSLTDLLITGTEDEGGEKKKKKIIKDAITPLQEYLNKAEKLVNTQRTNLEHGEEEHNKRLLEERIKAFESFLSQDLLDNDEIVRVQKQLSAERLKLALEEFKLENEALDVNLKYQMGLIDKMRADDLISDMEHNALRLGLEEEYLINKLNLAETYGQSFGDLANQQTKNEIESIELRERALNALFDSVSSVGDAIQNLAGDEEKLQGLRKIGTKITQAAAIAEQVLALKKQLVALSEAATNKEKIKGQALTLSTIKSNLAESVSEGIKAGASFTAGVGKAFSANPLLGLAALASVIGIIASLRGLFQNPSLATGSTDSLDSGGSGSSGGLGSGSTLYSFAGTGSTFANGGMVYGNSHTNGGEKFAVGGRVVELEGGEAVINKRSTAMFRSQLSAMNAAGGGVKFADGGIANSPSFAQTQFDVMGQSMMSSGGRVTVVEADITSTQNSVKTIESEASF